MALYKHAECLRQTDSPEFDKANAPGTPARWPGIYQCDFCGHEIVAAQHHIFPSENHHPHKSKVPIQWRLIVSLKAE